jgi:hypothetical protein
MNTKSALNTNEFKNALSDLDWMSDDALANLNNIENRWVQWLNAEYAVNLSHAQAYVIFSKAEDHYNQQCSYCGSEKYSYIERRFRDLVDLYESISY